MNVEVLHEVSTTDGLCFQLCRWNWENDNPSIGYRFIWREDKTGHLKPSRGQAFIPDAATILDLIAGATRQGWFRQSE